MISRNRERKRCAVAKQPATMISEEVGVGKITRGKRGGDDSRAAVAAAHLLLSEKGWRYAKEEVRRQSQVGRWEDQSKGECDKYMVQGSACSVLLRSPFFLFPLMSQ